MAFQTVFKRYELKYLITPEQREIILLEAAPFMTPDKYGNTTIRNIYFDTDDFRIIRRSLEKPVYKEKLRIRSYCKADKDSTVFVEIKKKYKGVVYKRRVAVSEEEAFSWLTERRNPPFSNQITDEIEYLMNFYPGIHPTVFLSYEREAYYEKNIDGFRITFDKNVLFRTEGLSLEEETSGTPLLPDNRLLMEIKCAGAVPLWMTDILSREGIYKTSFSKYGRAYTEHILPLSLKNVSDINLQKGVNYG